MRMISSISRHWKLTLFCIFMCAQFPAIADTPLRDDSSSGFKVFDGTLYHDKPDLRRFGIQPIDILYAARFWPDAHSAKAMQKLPDESRVRRVAREALITKEPVVIDIEHWPLGGGNLQLHENLAKYVTVLQWMRNEAPDLNIGYFAQLPMPAYGWALAGPGTHNYRQWQEENDRRSDLASLVDAIYPQLYTYFPDKSAWKRYAKENLREARRYGKPVYAFLWPQYSERNKELGQQYLPPDFWRLQLETVRKYADGIVIWGGWDGKHGVPAAWDKNAPWWLVTRDFMNAMLASKQRGKQ